MTREEALKKMQAVKSYMISGNPIWSVTEIGEAFDMAIEALGRTESQWIPCSERLPKQGQEVICQCRASIIEVLKLDAHGDWYQDAEHCYMRGFVIAWMPLPEAWRGE